MGAMKLYAKKWIPSSFVSCSLGILTSVALTSCDSKKQEDNTPAGEAPVAEKKVVSAQDRADKLGLLAMVPAETEAFFVAYDLPYLISAVEQSQTVKYLQKQSGDFEFDEIIEVDDGSDSEAVLTVSGQAGDTSSQSIADQCPVKELVIAYGPGQIELINALAKDYAKINEVLTSPSDVGGMTAPLLSRLMMSSITDSSPDFESIQQLVGILPQLELLKQIDFAPGDNMAPMIIMATLSSDAMMQVKQSVNDAVAMSGMANGLVEPHTVKVGELEYNGLVIKGEAIAPMIRMYKDQIPDVDPQVVENLAAGIGRGNLYIMMAFKGDTVIAAICTNPEKQLALPARAEDSILGKPAGSLADAWIDKKPAMAGYISPAFYKAVVDFYIQMYKSDAQTMSAMFKMMGSGDMSGKPADPAALQNAVEGFTALYTQDLVGQMERLDTSAGYSGYAWYDQGLNMEFVTGGIDDYNWDAPAAYTGVFDMPDVVAAYAGSMTEAYSQRSTALVEHMVQYMWGLYGVIETSQGEGSEYYQMANQLKPGVVKLWGIAKGVQPAFSQQYGVAIDINGKLPECKNGMCDIPADVVANGRIPRVTMVQGLKDRSKLGPAWEATKGVINEYAAQLVGDAVKLDDPASEEKDGLTSYSYECPVLPGYDMPAVTIGNDIYMIGTSKAYNYEVGKALKASKASKYAFQAQLNIEPMLKAADQWSKTKGKERQLGQVRDFFKALNADLKGISMSADRQEGKVHVRAHIEAR